MATITTLANAVKANKPVRYMDNTVLTYVVWRDVDLAAAVTAKGTALAAADVIEVLRLPADSAVIDVWAKKLTAFAGTSIDLTFDIGTGADVDQWVDGWDFDGAVVGTYATPVGVGQSRTLQTSDTIDITFATQTGTVTGGKVRIYALVADLGVKGRGEIAQPKS